MSVVTEHQPEGAARVYRVWHTATDCAHARVRDVVLRDVPMTDDRAGLPCSYCVQLPEPPVPDAEGRLRKLVALHHPDVNFEQHKAELVRRGVWGPKRVAAAIARLDPCDECNTATPITKEL